MLRWDCWDNGNAGGAHIDELITVTECLDRLPSHWLSLFLETFWQKFGNIWQVCTSWIQSESMWRLSMSFSVFLVVLLLQTLKDIEYHLLLRLFLWKTIPFFIRKNISSLKNGPWMNSLWEYLELSCTIYSAS